MKTKVIFALLSPINFFIAHSQTGTWNLEEITLNGTKKLGSTNNADIDRNRKHLEAV